MPVTQIVEFPGSTGLAAGANAYLFAQGSDTAVATASAVAERTNAKGIYRATFADVAAGDYLLVAKDASGNPICVDPLNGLLLSAATFQTASIANAGDFTAAQKASLNAATPVVTLGDGAITTATITDGAITDAKFTVPTEPTGLATGILGRIDQLWRRFIGNKTTQTATELKMYKSDGSTVVSTQSLSDDGTTQTQGGGS